MSLERRRPARARSRRARLSRLGAARAGAARMTGAAWLQIGILIALVLVGTRLLGPYLAHVLRRRPAPGDRVFLPVERALYRVGGVDPEREQPWTVYALSLLAFSAVSVVGLYLLQRVQGVLPLNPTDVEGVPPALAFNTAVSFVTNTNWQNYGGEGTMSHLTQMVGSDGAELRLRRGRDRRRDRARPGPRPATARRRSATSGSTSSGRRPASSCRSRSWSRSLLVSQGVVQTLRGPATAQTSRARARQIFRRAGREPGGDQGARDERRRDRERELRAPVREPDRLHESRRDARDPADPVRAHLRLRAHGRQPASGLGALRGDVRALARLGWRSPPPSRSTATRGSRRPARPVRGKEVRFGAPASALFAATTTGTSTGAVNAAHDSFTPGGGAVPLVNMMLGEVSPGRGRRGPLRDARLRAARRLPGRPDGRADARVPRQEDPGGGDEARRRSTCSSCPRSCSASRRRRCCSTTPRRRSSTRGRTG